MISAETFYIRLIKWVNFQTWNFLIYKANVCLCSHDYECFSFCRYYVFNFFVTQISIQAITKVISILKGISPLVSKMHRPVVKNFTGIMVKYIKRKAFNHRVCKTLHDEIDYLAQTQMKSQLWKDYSHRHICMRLLEVHELFLFKCNRCRLLSRLYRCFKCCV